MLWFVGIGINGYRGLSLHALDILKKCDKVYVERFTSDLSDSDIGSLGSVLGVTVKPVERWFVEDGREILENAKSRQVALVTYGDPMIATTHGELRSRAAADSIRTSVIHSASGIYSSIGETGLHHYKFGRMVTIMSDKQSAISVYNTIFDNLLSGCHTLILTEYSSGENGSAFHLSPIEAFKLLLEVEADQKYGVFSDSTFAVVASRVGTDGQQIMSGRVGSLASSGFGEGPHSVIITGPLHFTESKALILLSRNLDQPADNSQALKRISVQMVERYAPKAMAAVQHMREILQAETDGVAANKGMFEVLDNAEYYISDSKRFLNQGKHDLAVLSIGYAEGLVDALRFQKGVNPWETQS
jgi:diphthine synthase